MATATLDRSVPVREEGTSPGNPTQNSRLRAFISPLREREHEVHGFTVDEVRELMAGIHSRGDRLMTRFLATHFAVALGLAFYFDTWRITLLTGSIALGVFALSARLAPRTMFTRCLAGVSLQTFVALHIYQLHGLAEMHFFFFTGFTMMLVYQDGRAMWPGAWLIIGQHIVFAWFHNKGVPLHFFEVAHVSTTRLFYHFGIALVQVAICSYWSVLLRRQTLRDAWQKAQLLESGALLARQLDTIIESEAALRSSATALSASIIRQRAILDNIPDLAWVKDRSGAYVNVNATFARVFETTTDDVCGHTDRDYFPPDVVERLAERDARAIATGERVRCEEGYVDRSGAWHDVDTIVTPLVDVDNRVTGTMGIARDITARKRAEEAQRRLEAKMQQAQQLESLGVLAGGIAHDFNNLLMGVLGNAGLALMDLPDQSPVAQTVRDIETAATRAAELTRQLLAYSGRGQFVVQAVDVSRVATEMTHLLRTVISKKATLRLDLADGLPVVQADPTQVRQLVMNLITNASESLGERVGVIEMSTSAIDATAEFLAGFHGSDELLPGRYISLVVRDSGAGMDEATQRRIFDPFFTTKFTGRGLGLAAVIGILRAQRGGIRVESAPGRGSVFTLLFPAGCMAVSRDTASPPEPASTAWRGSGAVLLVDDDPVVRTIAARILRHAGFEIREAANGAEALAALAADDGLIRLVLLDVIMPRLDGGETLRAIRAHRLPVRVILSSGYTESDVRERIRGLLVDGFVQKPYSPDDLLTMVRQVLDGAGVSRSEHAA